MTAPPRSSHVTVGDRMPRIVLPQPAGGVFDSWDQTKAGRIQVYWQGALPAVPEALMRLATALAPCDADFYIVAPAAPQTPVEGLSWLIDAAGDLARVLAVQGPFAAVANAGGWLTALLPDPAPEAIAALVGRMFAASSPAVVRGQAPVLLLERVLEPTLCDALIEHWRVGQKLADGVASAAGASAANTDMKRREDVPVDEARLSLPLRDCLVRRVMPAILQAFQARIVHIEVPRVGCYHAQAGWFRRHRDNTTPFTAHRQFALSLNLNPEDEYEGGELRFPEFGRQLYRPPAGGGVVFSCSLLHEVLPVTRGRRFGVFTFLHDESREAQHRRMLAEAKARGQTGIQMR